MRLRELACHGGPLRLNALTTIKSYATMGRVILRRSSKDLPLTGVLTILAVGVFTVGTDLFVLNGLLPTIAADLRVSVSTAGQLTTIFAVTYAIGSPLLAACTGNWDRRILLAGGMAMFVLGMVGQAVGTTFAVLAVARVVAAIGAAAFQSNAFVVAGASAAADKRGRALALVAAGISVSSVLGVPIGVFVGQWIGWRGVMWGIAGLGLLVAVSIGLLHRVTVPQAGLRARLAVLVRPPVARVLAITVLGMTATFTMFVYLPVVAAPSAGGATISWVLLCSGIGSVLGNNLAGRWTDRIGPQRVRLISLIGTAIMLRPGRLRARACRAAGVLGDLRCAQRHAHGSAAAPVVHARAGRADGGARPERLGDLRRRQPRFRARRRGAGRGRTVLAGPDRRGHRGARRARGP
ncbi:MAG TPA: MFS transporter [Actinophytocola sp.]|uniref:MFS transporter n=1 Tax=Actinophytocola sp. TaxID=1872138 RepID=UPI002DDCD92C|nr:MFS transporter [Actinophytocola sp.]HEV2780115.1 MFS transporter [Actinophytocola sp.]